MQSKKMFGLQIGFNKVEKIGYNVEQNSKGRDFQSL